MTRRELLQAIGFSAAGQALATSSEPGQPGTQILDWEGDLSVRMMDGAHRFVEHKINESLSRRPSFWKTGLPAVSPRD